MSAFQVAEITEVGLPALPSFSPDALFLKTSTLQKVAQIVKLTIWLTN
jgi:hypothetical protein